MFLIIKSLSLSFCTLTAKCWCAFDGQCVTWINIQWVFDIRSRQWKASEKENMLFFVFVVSFSSMSVCDWPTQSSYPKPWTQFTSHGAAQMRIASSTARVIQKQCSRNTLAVLWCHISNGLCISAWSRALWMLMCDVCLFCLFNNLMIN